LTRLGDIHGSFTARTYTQAEGLAQNSVFAVYESRDGTVWAGTLNNGLSELRNGRFKTFTTADGLASNAVSSIAENADGTMWFGTPNGLSEMSSSGWRTYTVRDGLSSQDVTCLLNDSNGVLWIGTGDGLAFLNHGHVRVPRALPSQLQEQILGIAEDRGGWLWVATTHHVVQVKRSSLMQDTLSDGDVREYGIEDGLQGTEGVKRCQSVFPDSRGRIWFSLNRSLSVVTPTRATVNLAPALVHIEQVSADGQLFDLLGPILVPPEKQRIALRYAGLSFANPERVRYRYRLDALDHTWSEPVATREAQYANLSAGSYRFRVMASNYDGLWNGSEAAIDFVVERAFWETWWFRFLCVFCVALATLLAYRLRLYQSTRLLNMRFEERLAERSQIARELHDTLLQGLLSASMQLNVAIDQLPVDSPARPAMNRVLQVMEQIVEEGRNTVRGLRSSIDSAHELKTALSRVPEQLGNEQDIDFRVIVEGPPLPLQSAVRDDVYSISREALVNAFRHSGANNIDVQLQYAPLQLRIVVRDDGCGIDPDVLKPGRDGHWGLSGMRERAERIGARFRLWSRNGGGTEVELLVPGDVAFGPHAVSSAAKWFQLFRREKKNNWQ
jgi:signal transduction histidine kinase